MAWMTTDGAINRVTWRDRTAVKPRSEAVTRLVRGEWVTTEATVPTMTDWRRASSRVNGL